MRQCYILCVLLIWPVLCLAVEKENKDILKELDKTISDKYAYHSARNKQIDGLKNALFRAADDEQKYKLCDELFRQYLHFQADSALFYVNMKASLTPDAEQGNRRHEIMINRAEVMGVMGMYNEAIQTLRSLQSSELDGRLLEYYYRTYRACYGWLADYTAEPTAKRKYLMQTDDYRDSLFSTSLSEVDRNIAEAERMIVGKQADKAIGLLEKMLRDYPDPEKQTYLNYTLAEAYEIKKDTVKQIHYLAQTAILDLKKSVREYASLQKLARLIYEQGDLERAYRYLNCSMEDAVACNARLRFLEVTQFYPIIDKSYKAKEEQEAFMARMMFIGMSILAALLIIAVCYLYSGMKKLAAVRKSLFQRNRQLVSVNEQLAQTGKIKEVYIARYLERCVAYLEKLEQYRRSLAKLAMASKTEELFKAIRSDQFLRDERKMFYNEFDKSFLDLFPNFINDFNNLLTDEGKIFLKQGELLNTELRIFALIRLGVTDATSIAHFLGYSIATVYNYRSKIRSKAIGDKDRFEQEVMNL